MRLIFGKVVLPLLGMKQNAQEFSKKDFRKSQQEIKKCTKRMFHITSAGKAILDHLSTERSYFHKCTKYFGMKTTKSCNMYLLSHKVATWEIFSEFLIFCNLKIIAKYDKLSKIFANFALIFSNLSLNAC